MRRDALDAPPPTDKSVGGSLFEVLDSTSWAPAPWPGWALSIA